MNTRSFDTVVVGSGTAAYYCLSGLVEAGQSVAVVDERPYGGTCALRGCQPKKYLVANAEAVALAAHLEGRGIVSKPKTDWAALQALKNAFLNGRSEGEVRDWQQAGVATFHGRAVMTGKREITVGDDRLKARHIVLATGSTPRPLNIPGSEHIKSSEDFLELPELPRRIVFIGGGYVSFEFAHIARRAGSEEVTILHRSACPLPAFDWDMVNIVMEAGEAEGIRVRLKESPRSVERSPAGLVVLGTSGERYEADLVVGATGRVPNLTVLDGDAGRVQHSSHGVVVNEFLQSTSNPHVFAIGDCAATPHMLAPVADEEGKTAAKNILDGNVKTIDYAVVPSAVFTIPNIASVGLNEDQAREAGLDVCVRKGTTAGWPSSKRIGEAHAGFKVLINNQTDEIVGAHLARHNASEVINIFALAMKFKIKSAELAEFMWAYPTLTSDLKYMVK